MKYCSGCRACENICPTGCLRVITLGKKFICEIDREKCIDCGKCLRVCPMKRGRRHHPRKALIAFSKDASIVRRSSSGGIATLIYQYCIDHHINCIGVHFDEEYNLVYDFIYGKKDIARAAGSKYVYSDMNTIYQRIEDKLKNLEKVVMVGLPCHISGLKNYCKEKNISSDYLYTVDIVCHGLPMPCLFKKHLYKTMNHTKEPFGIYFREKDNPYGITVKERNGRIVYRRTRYRDEYMYLYQMGYHMESCYRCPYAAESRCGDITVKDYCYSEGSVPIRRYLLYGASHVLINTGKGAVLFEKINDGKLYTQETTVEEVVNADSIMHFPTPRPALERLFRKIEKRLGMEWAARIVYGRQMIAAASAKQNIPDKHLELFRIMSQWVKVKQEGKNLSLYFKGHGYNRIAVYGMSRVGEILVDELHGTGIEIAYGIDRNAAMIHSDIPIVMLEDTWKIVDAAVVTAVTAFEEIKEEVLKKLDCPVISLEEIIYEVLE